MKRNISLRFIMKTMSSDGVIYALKAGINSFEYSNTKKGSYHDQLQTALQCAELMKKEIDNLENKNIKKSVQ